MDDWITGIVESMGYPGIALLMALENVFPPVPSELVMPLAGYTAARQDLTLWLVIVVGSLGSLVGTLPWYAAGRWLGHDRIYEWVERHGHWLTIEPRELEWAEHWFGKRGSWIVMVGRIVPGARTLISVPAGFCQMNIWTYLGYSAIGTLVWTGGLAYLGHLLGERYAQVSAYVGPVTYVVLGAIILTYVVRLARMWRQKHQNHGHARN